MPVFTSEVFRPDAKLFHQAPATVHDYDTRIGQLHPFSTESADFVVHDCSLRLVVVLGRRVGNLRRSQVQLSLAEFDDRTETQIVATSGKIQCKLGLLEQLGCKADAFKGGPGIQICYSHISRDAIGKVIDLFGGCFGA